MSPVPQPQNNRLLINAFPIVVVFLFEVFSGSFEFVPVFRTLHPLLVLGGLGLIIIFATGQFRQVVRTPVGKFLTLFTLWFVFCIPMAIWRGGSFQVLVEMWSKSYLAFILTAGLILTLDQMRKIFHTIAYAVGFLACLALALHQYDQTGRLGLMGTHLGNANEFGFTLLLGVIFLSFLYMQGGALRKTLAVFLMFPVLVALGKTGSRGCMLGAGVLLAFAFFQAKMAVKTALVFATPIFLVVALFAVPSQLRERYTTLFRAQSDSSQTATEGEAIGSAESRLELLKDSITTTITHPLFGVGPGNFPVEQEHLALARGEPYGLWRVTHNSYTQLSSETGIPGLVIYLIFLVQCWRVLSQVLRRRRISSEVRLMAQALRASLLVLLTTAFFDSVAYTPNIAILAGLVTALSFVARDQAKSDRTRGKHEDGTPEPYVPEYEPALTSPLYN